jgi:hypothetical protein
MFIWELHRHTCKISCNAFKLARIPILIKKKINQTHHCYKRPITHSTQPHPLDGPELNLWSHPYLKKLNPMHSCTPTITVFQVFGPLVGPTLFTRAKIQRDPPGVGAWIATTIIESIQKQIVTAHVSIISSLTKKRERSNDSYLRRNRSFARLLI